MSAFSTACSKCGTPMPGADKPSRPEPVYQIRMIITGYACGKCGHYNNLKLRKGWKEYYKGRLAPC